MNGKSGNINNVCAQMYPQGTKVPGTELLCIFDADQVASKEFFLKTVPLFDGGEPAAAHAPAFDQAAPELHPAIAAPSHIPCSPLCFPLGHACTLRVATTSRFYPTGGNDLGCLGAPGSAASCQYTSRCVLPGDEGPQGGDLS